MIMYFIMREEEEAEKMERKRSTPWPGTQIMVEVGSVADGLWEARITGTIAQGETVGRHLKSRSEAVERVLAEIEKRNTLKQAVFQQWIAETRAWLNADES
jgi:DUF917 family protein